MLDYNKLRTFAVVAEELNVSRAAYRLGRTQSAISQQIKSLEDELGFLLLARKGSKLALTKEGTRVFSLAQDSFSQIDQNINVIKGSTQSLEGAIHIGINPDHCNDLLPQLMSDFLQEFPLARFEISQWEDGRIEEGLLDNTLDFGFVTVFKERERFERIPIFHFEEHLIASKDYLKKKGIKDVRRVDVETILSMEIIDYNEVMPCLINWINKNKSGWSRKLLEKKPSYIVGNHETRKRLIKANIGVGLLRDYMVCSELEEGSVVRVLPQFKSLNVSVDFVVRKNVNLNPLQEYFLEFVSGRGLQH